jgi:hypothetical protein
MGEEAYLPHIRMFSFSGSREKDGVWKIQMV